MGGMPILSPRSEGLARKPRSMTMQPACFSQALTTRSATMDVLHSNARGSALIAPYLLRNTIKQF